MKGGLCEPALAQMEVPFAREQPFAEEPLRALEGASFLEEARARHEDVLDVIGMVQQDQALRSDPEANDVAVLARQRRQRAEPIVPKGTVQPEPEESVRRPWEAHVASSASSCRDRSPCTQSASPARAWASLFPRNV
jgi:hypothetical protein